MARAMTPHKWSENSVALYVANRRPISDMLSSLLVKTADTGQVNWATVTTLPANNAIRDYEIYRFNDALQATAPIFIRVDHVSWPIQGGTERFAQLQFTVGTATDGAGNLRGVTTPPMICNAAYANQNPGNWNAHASTGTSGAQLVFFWGLTPPHLLPRIPTADSWSGVVIERFRNADGTANAEGYTAWVFDSTDTNTGAGLLKGQYSRAFAGGQSDGLSLMAMLPVAATGYFENNSSYAAAVHHFGPGLRGPSQAWLIGFNSDFPRATEVTLPHSGRQLTFMAIGSAGSTALPYATGGTQATMKFGFAPLLRWE